MKIAIVLTVKNEKRLLRNNLLYHKAIGVDKAFVYFDNTTDAGKESIADLDFVRTSNSVPSEKYVHLNYLKKFTSQAKEHHTARQCLNTFDAKQQCIEENIDWLISLDADELICTDIERPSDLKAFFKNIAGNVEEVNFKVLEVLQRKKSYRNVFREETLFKSNIYAFPKSFYNPFTKSMQEFGWWYGQGVGKGAIRVNSDLIPRNVHHYQKMNTNKPITIKSGNVLHYHAYDTEDFIKKYINFSDRPNTFLSGRKVESIKLLLRDIVNSSGLDGKQLENYFIENLMFDEKEIKKFKKGRKYGFFKIKPIPLKEITSVKRTFENLLQS